MMLRKVGVLSVSLGLAACSASNGEGSFAGTYTGQLTVATDGTQSSGSANETWTITQSGNSIDFGGDWCPGLGGTLDGDVATITTTSCPPVKGATTTYTGGTLTFGGEQVSVELTSTVVASNGSASTIVSGTLTKSGGGSSGSAGSAVGCYTWNSGTVEVSANNTVTHYCSPTDVCDMGTWTLAGSTTYTFSWQSGYTDVMSFSNGDLVPVGGSNAGDTATPTACPGG
jgi:hypothetical protein